MRRTSAPKRDVLPDPVYNSVILTKFINQVMLDGKKGVAERIVYGAFEIIKDKTGKDPMEVFDEAMKNVMPVLEVKARRAQQRKAERLAHEKNVRQGKRKPANPPERPPKKAASAGEKRGVPPRGSWFKSSRPRPGARAKPYAHSHPVKKGKGSFRKRED